ncbi:hypothetical protein [Escherichia phage ZL19]|uniref:Uncharacterized protein n=1 Tax=Escherichia phage ZL19 TaxID=2914037 RepID=A0A9E6YXK6_9CAUD|nr:hypothetical protein [Escherichia phage ZL19]
MITINLSDKDAAILKSIAQFSNSSPFEQMRVAKEVVAQINNQQFDVGEFESSRQYESLSVQSAGFIPKSEFTKGKGWSMKKSQSEYSYLDNWDKANKK